MPNRASQSPYNVYVERAGRLRGLSGDVFRILGHVSTEAQTKTYRPLIQAESRRIRLSKRPLRQALVRAPTDSEPKENGTT